MVSYEFDIKGRKVEVGATGLRDGDGMVYSVRPENGVLLLVSPRIPEEMISDGFRAREAALEAIHNEEVSNCGF